LGQAERGCTILERHVVHLTSQDRTDRIDFLRRHVMPETSLNMLHGVLIVAGHDDG
jgi:hypothetical protein